MKRIILAASLILLMFAAQAQETGYYNNTDGKSGAELRSALNDIIQDHQVFSYFTAKSVFKSSDADPENPENVILVYTGRSQENDDYGTGGDYINREHVWAKSHGDFGTEPPEGADFHNLKPADGSVNSDRSNKDFDNGGTEHNEADGCFFDSDSWEPRDEVKGDIARIIFYMATRYEGENGEHDLQVVDEVSTYPAAEHGKLSTLLEWNMQDLPDAFERNRNNVIFNWQQNRNPFIDNPEFAELIWNGQEADAIIIDNLTVSEDIDAETPVDITAEITSSNGSVSEAKIMWGLSYEALNNEVAMSQSGDNFSAQIPAQAEENYVYYKVVADDGSVTDESVVYSYYIPPTFNGELVTIYDIQGQTTHSPMADQIEDEGGIEDLNYGEVSTSGVVTANFGTNYFIQDGEGAWNGLLVYDPSRNPQIGDSIIITGIVKEYYNVTEMTEISTYYHIASGKTPPPFTDINTGDASEQYEGVLVRVTEAECTDANYQSNFYMWTVDDGSGELYIHNTSTYEFVPTEGADYTISGPLNWDFGEWKIELRYEDDVNGITDIEAPAISEINIEDEETIEIYFSEDVDEESAENENNYVMSGEVAVENAVRHLVLEDKVTLTVSPLSPGEYYTLTINNVEDQYGNATVDLVYEFGYQTSIEEVMEKGSFKVYPNPTSADIITTFHSKKETAAVIKVIDFRGREIRNIQTDIQQGANTIEIGLTNARPGIYMLMMEFPEGRTMKKIIKK